jgi:Rieske 2Fe-2S family protein
VFRWEKEHFFDESWVCMGRADGFDKTGHHLVALRFAEWHGWIFANAGDDAPPFEEHAGNLAGLIRNYGYGELVVGARHD